MSRTTSVHSRFQVCGGFEGVIVESIDFCQTRSEAFDLAKAYIGKSHYSCTCVYDRMAHKGAKDTWQFGAIGAT